MIWYSGLNNYKIQTTYNNTFTIEYLEQEFNRGFTIQEVYKTHLQNITRPFVEVLYSGGLDSEIVMLTLLEMKIPIRVKCLKLYFNDLLLNGYDLYFIDNFCRQRNIDVHFIDLEITKFHGSAVDIDICSKYHMQKPYHSFTFYALQQCEGYIVMGGEYPWPYLENKKYKLHCPNIPFNSYELFFKDYGLDGIGNMQTHSLNSLYLFLQSHLKVIKNVQEKYFNKFKYIEVGNIKHEVLQNLGYQLTPRFKMNGFEPLIRYKQYHEEITEQFQKQFTQYKGTIIVPKSIQDLLDSFSM